MLPDKDRMCHRTGFEQSCRELVSSEKCKRWKPVLGEHPQTRAEINHYDCIDDHVFLLLLSLGRNQDQTTATVDKLCKENKEAAAHVAASQAQLGHDMRQAAAAVMEASLSVMEAASKSANTLTASQVPKLIEARRQ